MAADALQTCVGRLEIPSQLRRAVHGKSDALRIAMHHHSWYPTFVDDVQKSKRLSTWKKVQAWSSRENAHQNLYKKFEGGVDVISVVTLLVRGIAQVLHGDQVVELSVQLEVQEVEGKEEDREGQVEVEEEKVELKEKRT